VHRVIKTEGLTRTFGRRIAVDHLDLEVVRGTVVGLLGPNGAGKTTTIRMLTTLLAPTSGRARVCGFDVTRQPAEVRRRLGYVSQNVALQTNHLLTGRENVEIEAALRHVPPRQCRARTEEVLEVVGLLPDADRRIDEYSGGMRKRLDLAAGMLHRPELLVLDEPSLGLDVQARHRIWDYLTRLRDDGVTVLLATNYLDEADHLCSTVAIIDHGRAILTGSPDELKRAVAADVVQVETDTVERLRSAIADRAWVKKIVDSGSGELHVYVEDASVALPEMMRTCVERGVELRRVTYKQPTLDDVFLLHTGRALGDGTVEPKA
jgi:ABC-2 type transport system ATP-binding protein